MANKQLTLSLVIPAFNEERHLKACLEAVAQQTVKPDEVIVVDNNSSDRSVEIAKGYPWVNVITEKRQGRGWARSAGFDAATSDIIGRIDADSVISSDWVARVKQDFTDPDLAAVTGLGMVNLLPLNERVFSTFWSRVYFWLVHAYFGANTMWGANSALRREYWQCVRTDVSNDDKVVHEDEDVSLHIIGIGGKIIQDNQLLIQTHGQSYLYLPKLSEYLWRVRKTKLRHVTLGTFKRPAAQPQLLGFWSTLPGRFYAMVAGVIFIAGSVLTWPIDEFYIRVLHKRPWLN